MQMTAEKGINVNGGWAIVTVRDADESVVWSERVRIPNLITNVGKNEIMLNGLSGNYLFLTGATPAFAAGNTMASNSFTELTAYTEATRPGFTVATTATPGTVNNAGNLARFSINGSITIGGFGLATSSTKSETASVLISGRALSIDQAVVNGQFVDIDYEFVGS